MTFKEKIDVIANAIKQAIALAAINIFAFTFDGQWLYAAIAVDCIVLGYDIKSLLGSK